MIEDIELFSGAPEQSHWPVLFDISVKNDNPKRGVLNYKMANWEEISIQMENSMVENMDSMITVAPTKALPTFMGLKEEFVKIRFHGKHFVNISSHTGAIN